MPVTCFSNANNSPLAAVMPLTGIRNSSVNELKFFPLVRDSINGCKKLFDPGRPAPKIHGILQIPAAG